MRWTEFKQMLWPSQVKMAQQIREFTGPCIRAEGASGELAPFDETPAAVRDLLIPAHINLRPRPDIGLPGSDEMNQRIIEAYRRGQANAWPPKQEDAK